MKTRGGKETHGMVKRPEGVKTWKRRTQVLAKKKETGHTGIAIGGQKNPVRKISRSGTRVAPMLWGN